MEEADVTLYAEQCPAGDLSQVSQVSLTAALWVCEFMNDTLHKIMGLIGYSYVKKLFNFSYIYL